MYKRNIEIYIFLIENMQAISLRVHSVSEVFQYSVEKSWNILLRRDKRE